MAKVLVEIGDVLVAEFEMEEKELADYENSKNKKEFLHKWVLENIESNLYYYLIEEED